MNSSVNKESQSFRVITGKFRRHPATKWRVVADATDEVAKDRNVRLAWINKIDIKFVILSNFCAYRIGLSEF